jgi:hypothetical protein
MHAGEEGSLPPLLREFSTVSALLAVLLVSFCTPLLARLSNHVHLFSSWEWPHNGDTMKPGRRGGTAARRKLLQAAELVL